MTSLTTPPSPPLHPLDRFPRSWKQAGSHEKLAKAADGVRMVALDYGSLALGEASWRPVTKQGSLELHERTPHDDPDAVVERCRGAQVVFTNKVPLSREVLARLPDLKMVQVMATGYNTVDVAAAKALGIVVCNVPAYSTNITAQHAVALTLELCHRLVLHDSSVRAGDWCRSREYWYRKADLVELEGSTVGLLGFGAIGRRTGELLRAFGVARVLAWTPSKRQAPEWPEFAWASSAEELFEQSDVVSLHCPLNAATDGIVGRDLIWRMKPSALLVNTARGGLVDEAALAEALIEGRLAGAAVDVLRTEPMSAASPSPLLMAPNCVITPHIGKSSVRSRAKLIQMAQENVGRFLAGEEVKSAV